MARTLYGGSPADVIAQVTVDDGDYAPASATLTAWDAETGGTQITDLQDAAGSTISVVTPDALGRVLFKGPDAYTAAIWLEDAASNRWRINPGDLASRVGGVSKVTYNGGDHTGDVTIPDVNWTNLSAASDFPDSIAAGATDADARAAIGALGPDDASAVSGLDSLTDVDTSDANPDDVLTALSDSTFSFAPPQAPPNFIPAITKNEGDSTPGGTAPGTLVFVLAGAGSAWGYDTDMASPGGARSTSGTTCVITLTQPAATGRWIVVGVAADAAGGTQSTWTAVDTKSNTYTTSTSLRQLQGTTNQTAILYAKVTTALVVGDTITVTTDVARTQIAAKAASVVGAVASSPLDKSALGGSASTASLTIGPSATTTQVDEIAFGVFGYQGSGITFTPTNGWILAGAPQDSAATTSRRTCVLVYKVLTATAAVSATGNTTLTAGGASQTVNYSAVEATFKKA